MSPQRYVLVNCLWYLITENLYWFASYTAKSGVASYMFPFLLKAFCGIATWMRLYTLVGLRCIGLDQLQPWQANLWSNLASLSPARKTKKGGGGGGGTEKKHRKTDSHLNFHAGRGRGRAWSHQSWSNQPCNTFLRMHVHELPP